MIPSRNLEFRVIAYPVCRSVPGHILTTPRGEQAPTGDDQSQSTSSRDMNPNTNTANACYGRSS